MEVTDSDAHGAHQYRGSKPMQVQSALYTPHTEPIGRGPGYDETTPLCLIPIGSRFMCYFDYTYLGIPDEPRQGTLLWVSAGSCEIWWDGDRDSCRVQPELDVYVTDLVELTSAQADLLLAHIKQSSTPLYNSLREAIQTHMASTPAPTSNPTIKALLARWGFQLGQLKDKLQDDDKAAAAACMVRVEKNLAEAVRLGVTAVLPLPDFEYAPLQEAIEHASSKQHTQEEERGKSNAQAHEAEEANSADRKQKTKKASDEREAAKVKHKAAVKAEKEAGEATSSSAPKPKAEKTLRPCLDGCGKMVPGNFAMGHDAKLKSLLTKIERGDLGTDAVPDICQDLVVIRKGDVVQDLDSAGKVKSEKQTYKLIAAPVRFPGRDDIRLTQRAD